MGVTVESQFLLMERLKIVAVAVKFSVSEIDRDLTPVRVMKMEVEQRVVTIEPRDLAPFAIRTDI